MLITLVVIMTMIMVKALLILMVRILLSVIDLLINVDSNAGKCNNDVDGIYDDCSD